MASLRSTWRHRRTTWRWFGYFWRTTPARVSPPRYGARVNVLSTLTSVVCFCVSAVVRYVSMHLPQSLVVITTVVLTTFISSPPFVSSPSSISSPAPPHTLAPHLPVSPSVPPSCSRLFPALVLSLILSISHYHSVSSSPTVSAPSTFTPPPPSLHECHGRASLIGSVCWWRQSDLELVTDVVRSAG